MKKNVWLALALVSLLAGCREGRRTPVVLDFDAAVVSRARMGLSRIVRNLQYVPLDIPDDDSLRVPGRVYVSDGRILLVPWCADPPYLFDEKGRLLARIGKGETGRPPYRGIVRNAFMDAGKGCVVLFGDSCVYRFGLDGRCLSTDSICFPCAGSRYWTRTEVGGTDDRLLAFRMNVDSTIVYRGDFRTLPDLTRIPGVYDVQYVMRNTSLGTLFPGYSPFISFFRDHAVFYDGRTDRYFRFYYDGRVEQPYTIYCGLRNAQGNKGRMYLTETPGCLFMRLVIDNRTQALFLYRKSEGRLYCLGSRDWGFRDDIDGWIDFWPDGVASDGRLFMVVSNSRFRWFASRSGNSGLQTFARNLTGTGPVVVFATLK